MAWWRERIYVAVKDCLPRMTLVHRRAPHRDDILETRARGKGEGVKFGLACLDAQGLLHWEQMSMEVGVTLEAMIVLAVPNVVEVGVLSSLPIVDQHLRDVVPEGFGFNRTEFVQGPVVAQMQEHNSL